MAQRICLWARLVLRSRDPRALTHPKSPPGISKRWHWEMYQQDPETSCQTCTTFFFGPQSTLSPPRPAGAFAAIERVGVAMPAHRDAAESRTASRNPWRAFTATSFETDTPGTENTSYTPENRPR